MSVTTISDNLEFQAKVKFFGLSQLPGDNDHCLTASILGGWTVVAWIPTAPPGLDAPSNLFVVIYRRLKPRPWRVSKVTMIVKGLNGEAEDSISWDDEDKETYAHSALMTDVGDGFDLIIHITTQPLTTTHPYIFNKAMLRTISTLILRPDEVADIKFLLFSRRRQHEHPYGAQDPLPVYANSAFLKSQCEYFNDMFSDSSYSESQQLPFDTSPDTLWIEEYDYESDSDLGSASDNEPSEEATSASESGSDDTPASISPDETKEPDSAELPQVQVAGANPRVDSSRTPDHSATRPRNFNGGRIGNIVPVKDTAYVTWQAMIFYLFTSQISFAPLSSSGKPRTCSEEEITTGLSPLKPSAKSMYRLADKLGLDDLCKLSLSHIQSELSVEIILHEIFSAFTSRYKPIRDMELEFVFDHWDELKNTHQFHDILNNITCGNLPHSLDVLKAILTH